MHQEFYKYQGTGNDFVIIDDRENLFDRTNDELINKLCDRRFGIGGDGLMLLGSKPGYDFEMVYFNADGHPGSMCGNGGRALVQFAQDLGVIKDKCHFIASDGKHEAFFKDGLVNLHMKDVSEVEKQPENYFLDTGSPHYVGFVKESLTHFDILGNGKQVRHSDRFSPSGTNVNFVEILGSKKIRVRTFERGVEDETLSCGTGVTACAIATYLKEGMESPIKIKVEGGELAVSFTETETGFKDIYLIGPAIRVFKGQIEI